MEEYKNVDGTYTSPKNGKIYKSIKAFRAHWFNSGSGGWSTVNSNKIECKYCAKKFGISNITKHENSCYLNPVNTILCVVCNKPIKNYKHSKGTCSKSCANTHFKSGLGNGNWKGERYTTLCFVHHKKKCVVCGEEKIVAVHHYDLNHNNNEPSNLIPLCPTHHQYVHSRYKDEVQSIIDEYIEQWNTSV
jgi:hypothetical protein